METFFVGQVEYQDTRIYSFKIRACDPTESLLTCSVPHLQFYFMSLDVYCLPDEIDANRGITLRLKISEIKA